MIVQGNNEDLSAYRKICGNILDIFFDKDDNLVFINQGLDINIEIDKSKVINECDDEEDDEINIDKGNNSFKDNKILFKI